MKQKNTMIINIDKVKSQILFIVLSPAPQFYYPSHATILTRRLPVRAVIKTATRYV